MLVSDIMYVQTYSMSPTTRSFNNGPIRTHAT
jgi:hypothetical protein